MNGTDQQQQGLNAATDPVAELTRAASEFGVAYRAIGTATIQRQAATTGVEDARRALAESEAAAEAVTVDIEEAKAAARVSGQAFVAQVTTLVGSI